MDPVIENGTYVGLTPTDESGVALGEVRVTITTETVEFEVATGLKLELEVVPRSELCELPADRAANAAQEFLGSDQDIESASAYSVGEDGAIFLFLPEHSDRPDAPRVLVFRSAEVDLFLGPTVLFSPQQVAAGVFDRVLQEIEEEQGDPGVVPRVDNGGLRRGSTP